MSKNTDFGPVLGAQVGTENVHVGPGRPTCPKKTFFLGFQERSKTQLQLKSLLNQMIHFKTPKLDPWGEGRERGKIDVLIWKGYLYTTTA